MRLYLIAAEMGYGHLRAAFPFKDLAYPKLISYGNDEFASKTIKTQWKTLQDAYEFISRNKNAPIIGKIFYKMLDNLLHIPNLYTKFNLSLPTFQVEILEFYIKNGFYDEIKELVKKEPLPVLSTFYAPAIALNLFSIPNNFCFVTDSDINRVWAAKDAANSSIIYFVASNRAALRLKKYGVPEKNIFFTGYPFNRNIFNNETVRISLAKRLKILDPKGNFAKNFLELANKILGFDFREIQRNDALSISFAVGGAGAQKELAKKIIKSFRKEIQDGLVKINLIAGTRLEVKEYFENLIRQENLGNNHIKVIYCDNKLDYFEIFDKTILETDILWTKPSELSFYSALGLPLILSSSIGSQERANKKWLRDEMGIAFPQYKPSLASEWIKDFLDSGRLAEVAFLGYLKQNVDGYERILEIIKNKSSL